ncbi:MAG: helix-turn-helix domain-containing protein [Candidatus Magasanikbacteria bacterium]|nr:helix-turn-helix domain-containing protein [Candidatus Magasanikbacteria bacterium]
MKKTWKTNKIKELVKAFLSLKKEEDMLKFLRDVCSLEELDNIASRWQAAKLLEKGMSYRDVAKKTGMSTTTVTRIAYWMKNGEGGYSKVLKK